MVSIGASIPAKMRAALDEMREDAEPKPSVSQVVTWALSNFLEESGYWPQVRETKVVDVKDGAL